MACTGAHYTALYIAFRTSGTFSPLTVSATVGLCRNNPCSVSIPFFYEPNFTALVAPLPAALRIQEDMSQSSSKIYDRVWPQKKYEPTVYGDFLMRKVDANFVPSREQSRATSREQSRAGSREGSVVRAGEEVKA